MSEYSTPLIPDAIMITERHRFTHFDPEELKEVINGSELEHTILSPEACTAEVFRVAQEGFSAETGFYSFPVFVRGQFPAGKICIGMSRGSECPTWANGRVLSRPSMQIYLEGSELLYRAGKSTHWFAFCLSREKLQSAALEWIGAEVQLPSRGSLSFDLTPAEQQSLFHLVESASSRASPEPFVENLLLRTVLDVIARSHPLLEKHYGPRRQHAFNLVARADHLLRHSVGFKYSSNRLCKILGVSERSLQSHFRESLGVSPKTWHRILSLNRARTLLLHHRNRPGVIAEVAMDCGFEHLGRFSESYRKLFDELPSETLQEI